MLPDGLQELMVLQDRDAKKSQLEKILFAVPRERSVVEARIAAHREGIEAARRAVVALELKRKELETTLGGLEEQIRRYRSQQLLVRKNDEYQALTHEIEQTEARISDLEGEEIELLYALDNERARATETESRLKEEIGGEEAQLGRLAARERQIAGDLAALQREVDAARTGVRPSLLPRYDLLCRTVGLPVIVPLRDQKCGGCHLKVSAGVETEARKGNEIIACDNCTRLLFFEP
jgi:hypothetical protein